MYELIITEKPNAAKKIAEALADGKPIKESVNGVPYYKITHGKKDLVVACAVGHLFGLAQHSGKKGDFPVFDVEWVPNSELSKSAAFSKKYLDVIQKLAKGANEFTVATDYDIEGEVIGLNIIIYLCKQKDARRMKFSTLTKDDLVNAYEHASKHLDWGQANAGVARHKLDWFYGINTSRALTSSIRSVGNFKLMSSGRVQGPALKLIVDREREIQNFKSELYWQIELLGTANKGSIDAWHMTDKFWEKKLADSVIKKVSGVKEASIKSVDKKSFEQAPPYPFDLTSLQLEAHRCLNISPKRTLEVAQDLYTSGFISYPRTSSQQLPKEIGFDKIISSISKQPDYKDSASSLLKKKNLSPNNGKKTDPAHPAIFPTGIAPPKNLSSESKRIYDLIVRRFLATFGSPATRQTMKITIDCNNELFVASGTTTLDKGWHVLYGRYASYKEEELPQVNNGDKVKIEKITLHDKETQPPSRFNEASVIKELEKRNLGTKSTRAQIVDTLFQRGYVDGRPIQATQLGIRTLGVLEKYSPTIVDEALTKYFEEEMDLIRSGEEKEEKVLDEAKKAIIKIIDGFKKNEEKVGKELSAANFETRDEMSFVGKCPVCKVGDLQLRKGKFGMFIACNKYPDCKTTFSIPANSLVRPAKKVCPTCGYPVILSIRKGKRPQELCINMDCPAKDFSAELKQEVKELDKHPKKCPRCKKGTLVVRRSLYGPFVACSTYPKCRYTEHRKKDTEEDEETKEPSATEEPVDDSE